MHDLVHDLALSIAKGECSVVTKKSTLAAKVCHLSLLENGQEVTTQLEKLSKVQTIIFITEQPASILEACIARFKYLRVLDLSNSSFEVLPSSIGSLKHLRYLDLTKNQRIKQLPDSICKLHSLQTLQLGDCSNLEGLPKGIRDIISLRFLVVTTKHTCLSEKTVGCLDSLRYLLIGGCENLKCVFEGMEGHLTNLRTLVVAQCPSLTSLSLSIKHLTALKNLQIVDCEELNLMEMEGEDNQYLKLSLQNLIISSLPKLEVFPQQLQGSANTLRQLLIQECENLIALPKWLPRLKSLQTLMIDNCPKLSSLSEVRKGPTSLRKFIITRLSKLEVLPQWLQGSANTLQLLGIGHCENLKALPEWLPRLKSLRTLQIVECLKLSSLPEGMEALTALRKLEITDCPDLSRKCREEDSHKIAHVPKIVLDEEI